ncbi:hypothetical protein Ancab_016226 [Ancistrocladus abbreviatus]
MLRVKIDGEVFPIYVVEEQVKIGDQSASTREAKEGVFASPSSPSTSISVVLDSFGNYSVGEQQLAVETASGVVAENSKFNPANNVLVNIAPFESRPAYRMVIENGRNFVPFQDVKCRYEGVCNISKQTDLTVSRPLGCKGHPTRCEPIFLSGPERLNGGPLRLAHGQGVNREGTLVGPGIRPTVLKSTEATQKEEVSMFRLSPGPAHIQNDRGKFTSSIGFLLSGCCVVADISVGRASLFMRLHQLKKFFVWLRPSVVQVFGGCWG